MNIYIYIYLTFLLKKCTQEKSGIFDWMRGSHFLVHRILCGFANFYILISLYDFLPSFYYYYFLYVYIRRITKFELVTFASLSVIPTNWIISWKHYLPIMLYKERIKSMLNIKWWWWVEGLIYPSPQNFNFSFFDLIALRVPFLLLH